MEHGVPSGGRAPQEAPTGVAIPVVPPSDTHPASSGRPLSSFHPAAAGILLFVDNLWMLADWNALVWIVTIPLSFLSVFIPTLCLQRFSRRDRWRIALGKALALGVVAAVPTSVCGTPVGVALLAWAGIEWKRR